MTDSDAGNILRRSAVGAIGPHYVRLYSGNGERSGQILIDQHDVSSLVTSVSLTMEPGQLPTLAVTVLPDAVPISYEGYALVDLWDPSPGMNPLAEWLEQQLEDLPGLEAAAMAGALDSSPVAALMAELIRRARV